MIRCSRRALVAVCANVPLLFCSIGRWYLAHCVESLSVSCDHSSLSRSLSLSDGNISGLAPCRMITVRRSPNTQRWFSQLRERLLHQACCFFNFLHTQQSPLSQMSIAVFVAVLRSVPKSVERLGSALMLLAVRRNALLLADFQS